MRAIEDEELETGDIVVVDDEASVVAQLGTFLSARGYRVRTAGSLSAAREQLARRRPDLLLCDLSLRDGDAREALPDLRRDGLLPATIVLAGHPSTAVEGQFAAVAEVLGVVAKPVALEALARRIAQHFAEIRRVRAEARLPLP